MTKTSTKHSLDFTKDPLNDRRAMISDMKGFKNSSMPKNPFKESTPKTASDAFYTPHKGKVAK